MNSIFFEIIVTFKVGYFSSYDYITIDNNARVSNKKL